MTSILALPCQKRFRVGLEVTNTEGCRASRAPENCVPARTGAARYTFADTSGILLRREQMISITGCGISPSYIVDWGTHPRIRIRNARLVVALCPAVTISPNTPWTDQEIGSRDGIAPMHPSYLHGSTRDPDLHGRDACLPVLCLVYAGLDPLDQVAQDMW
ncbi:hypothetical protein EDB86DRAFT_2836012 [Lactarius hatsudake]|nr:hypothetical protein EDB86DRAFT_2836012 [Lactarius hatsudake]